MTMDQLDPDLQPVYEKIMEAVCAEDIYGNLRCPETDSADMALLESKHQELLSLVDPKKYTHPDDKDSAMEAKAQLLLFFEKAKERVENGFYGQKAGHSVLAAGRPVFTTGKRQYYMGGPIASGSVATIFEGECLIGDDFAGRVVIKIADDPADNDLLKNEIKALKLLHEQKAKHRKHLPFLMDQFVTTDDRQGLVLRYLDDSYDFYTVRARKPYKNGVYRKDMVWMLNRLLSAAGYAHHRGLLHGNIEPSHLLIRPCDHNLFLIDWTGAVVDPFNTGDNYKVFTEHFSAPEVKKKGTPHPASDIYSIGMCMIYILGGDIESKKLPDDLEEDLARFIRYMVLDSPKQRAPNAWSLHSQLDKLVVKLWGPKQFRPFPM